MISQTLVLTSSCDEAMGKGVMSKWKYRNPEDVITALRERHAIGLPISSDQVQRGPQPDRGLYTAVIRLCGTWSTALQMAGLAHCALRQVGLYSSPESVIEGIRHRHNQGLSLLSSETRDGANGDNALWYAARKHFGSWYAALAKAGVVDQTPKDKQPDDRPMPNERLPSNEQRVLQVNLRKLVNYPDAASVVTAIQRRRDEGMGLKRRELTVGAHTDPALLRAVIREFESWPAALQAAGIDPARKRPRAFVYENEKAVAERVRELHTQGSPLNATSVRKTENTLYKSARRLFGSWEKCLTLAGLSCDEIPGKKQPRFAGKEEILEAICGRKKAGLPLNAQALRSREKANCDPGLFYTARKIFGSWPKAVQAAGLACETAPEYKRSSRGFLWAYPSPADVIAAIRESTCRVEDWPDDLKEAARHHFGTTSNALVAVQ